MLEPEIARAKAGESVLLFMDGVHFVQAAFLGCLWCFSRIFIRSPSGRKRWNVLGNLPQSCRTIISPDNFRKEIFLCPKHQAPNRIPPNFERKPSNSSPNEVSRPNKSPNTSDAPLCNG